MSDKYKCPQCGKYNRRYDRTCIECGYEVDRVTLDPKRPVVPIGSRVNIRFWLIIAAVVVGLAIAYLVSR